ncbi:MAG: type II toxin-antitoxin system mRNA interferase toxin, RelE/StbE family [Candidatus Kuenenbacteria bacterium]
MREIIITRKFEKDFQKVPPVIKLKTEKIIQIFKKDPFFKNFDIKKLKGFKKFWRVKIDKNWRLIYIITPNAVELLKIKHRKDIYKTKFEIK